MQRETRRPSAIKLATQIRAPIERCFDLARSIDLHTASASSTQEGVVAGRTSGLIGLGESVTFRGRHFGVRLTHSSLITPFNPPFFFRDEMKEGLFAISRTITGLPLKAQLPSWSTKSSFDRSSDRCPE